VTATFTFLATGPKQIFSLTANAPVAPGTNGFYSPSTVPTNAPEGTYTLTVTVTYNGASSSGKSQFTVKMPCPVISNYRHCDVVVNVTAPSGTIGASAYIEVYKPPVATGDLESIAQLALWNNTVTFDIEEGWMVAPYQQWVGKNGTYTDSNTHLFVFVRDISRLTNQACLVQPTAPGSTSWTCGFVPASGATDYPGEILSLPAGTVKTFYVVNINGNWWIQYDANWVGYIQGSWFGGQFTNVAGAGWQGEIATKSSNPTTQMGNGTCGSKSSPLPAHFYTMRVKTPTQTIDAWTLNKHFSADDANLYNGKYYYNTSTRSTLAYGGPTGCP
jgi:hypothetical protein